MEYLVSHRIHIWFFITTFMLLASLNSIFGGEIHDAAEKGNLEKVMDLLSANPSLVSSKDILGRTPLFLASQMGHKQVAKLLLLNGANINLADSDGFTPLIVAINNVRDDEKSECSDVVKLLLEKGADIKIADRNGSTALHTAANNGDDSIVELLLNKGADVNAMDKEGLIPLNLAVIHSKTGVIKLLINKRPDIKVLDLALVSSAYNEDKDTVELLLTNGAEANQKGSETPLQKAAEVGNKEIVELLLARGAEINPKDSGSPLIAAVTHHDGDNDKNQEVVKLLLAKGVEVDAKDQDGKTALFYAAQFGEKKMLQLLLSHGAFINVKDKEGWTPLRAAKYRAESNHDFDAIVAFLISKGAKM